MIDGIERPDPEASAAAAPRQTALLL